jgi:hypothetical protein
VSVDRAITDFHRELAAADLMLRAAQIEFQAATYRVDQARLDAARDKLRTTLDAWCDAQLAATTDGLRRIAER